jgi:starch synthase
MSIEPTKAESVRFQIWVNGPTYRSLADRLRGSKKSIATAPRVPRREVKAEIEFDLQLQEFSLVTIDNHSLPTSVAVERGSVTHRSLARLLARHTTREQHADFTNLLQKIIETAPTLTPESLVILQRDLEIRKHVESKQTRPTYRLQEALAPSLSLELDDSPATLVFPERQPHDIATALQRVSTRARLKHTRTVGVDGNTVTVETSILLPRIPGAQVEVFLHWGSYDECASPWRDELVQRLELSRAGIHTLTHTLNVSQRGHHGAAVFLLISGDPTRVWIGRPWLDDAKFWIAHDDSQIARAREEDFTASKISAISRVTEALRSNAPLQPTLTDIRKDFPFLGIGRLLQDAVTALADDPTTIERLARDSSLSEMLKNYGVGEIVFSTPEGPHAAAGGLAQVISGLPPELARVGIPVTIISPLYAFSNGSKHHSAKWVLEHGLAYSNQTKVPAYVGTVDINLGPTYYSGTTCDRRPASTIPVAVYLAEFEQVRFFLLANPSVFDRIYQPVFADEQLRRAIVLSKATLEVIATSHFGIRPSAIISNDWLTACVPALAALDARYRNIPWLRACKTVHMIHNGGADYHGRLPINVGNEDLWPMLNIAPEHFFGFRDPHRYDLLNLTMAAAHHATGGVLTVSEPYAKQLVSQNGGDGLEFVLQHKQDSVFGISNGINRKEVDRYLAHLCGKSDGEALSLDELITSKQRTKAALQERYGLTQNPEAKLISCVGRMVEQKGLSLLSGFVAFRSHSALEEILISHPDAQLLFAGPLTAGDKAAADLAACVGYLRAKYPGRIAAHFDYVPHSEALRVILGSTFFLMPSRFEPGGITQLEALAAGTLVVGRNVGGISATIAHYDATSNIGNGFLCNDYCPTGFAHTVSWALKTTRNDVTYKALVSSALSARHSWSDRVPVYQNILQKIVMGTPQPTT